ncbi:hypothetical protein ACHAXT_011940 [Thalassiosira profunda]
MNKPSKGADVAPQWLRVVLPFLAGLLHLQVFYYAAFHCVFRATVRDDVSSVTSDEFKNECYLLDRAIFVAYIFDLICCYLKAIPFSRCNRSSDIIGHHVPTLALALPLAIPLWSGMRQFEGTALSILDAEIGNEQRALFINSYTLASGFAYVSSLNEVFMCFQRVEMSLQGVQTFRDIPLMKHKIFTSRAVVMAELCYKFCFFWGMSWIACKACCDFDRSIYDATVRAADDGSVWRSLLTVYSSPAVLRGALFRAFSIVMYPSMGMRSLKKIKSHYREGRKEAKKVD